jgi:DNA-binding NarL/FixJ family response regulator
LTKQALNASANYLLEKPFTYAALRNIVNRILVSPGSLQYCADRGLEKLKLTDRENEIARLILKGLSNFEIAKTLSISEKTVKQYVTQIFEKSAVSSRAEFFSYIFPI